MRLRLAAILLAVPLLAGFEISDQAKEFTNYGVVGATCIVLAWVLWWKEKEKAKLVKAYDEERASLNAARIVDYKDMAATLSSVRAGLAEWTAARVEGNSTVVALGQAINSLAATIQLHTAAIDRQTEIIDRAAVSNRELREALLLHGVRP